MPQIFCRGQRFLDSYSLPSPFPMAAAASSRAVFCELSPKKSPVVPRLRSADKTTADGGNKIVLQPRLCTLRSYGSGSRDGAIRRWTKGYGDDERDEESNFFPSLAEYIQSSRKSQDFETVSGRLAMITFAAAVGVEFVTGNSLFKKLELQQITEAAGLCMAVVALSTTFAWFSSARTQIGQMFTLSCNQFVDSLIDNLVDGLFYDSELSDWSDDT